MFRISSSRCHCTSTSPIPASRGNSSCHFHTAATSRSLSVRHLRLRNRFGESSNIGGPRVALARQRSHLRQERIRRLGRCRKRRIGEKDEKAWPRGPARGTRGSRQTRRFKCIENLRRGAKRSQSVMTPPPAFRSRRNTSERFLCRVDRLDV